MGKIKGTAILDVVRMLRQSKDKARSILPQHLHGFLEDRILVSSWYPEKDAQELIRALAKILPDPGMDVYEYMGRLSARADLSGIYSRLIVPGNPKKTLSQCPVIWEIYHDTGKQRVVASGDSHITTELSGYEHPSREICSIMKGWQAALVEMAGGKKPVVVHKQCVLDGAKACRFEVSWVL